jgi:hypothetical protein
MSVRPSLCTEWRLSHQNNFYYSSNFIPSKYIDTFQSCLKLDRNNTLNEDLLRLCNGFCRGNGRLCEVLAAAKETVDSLLTAWTYQSSTDSDAAGTILRIFIGTRNKSARCVTPCGHFLTCWNCRYRWGGVDCSHVGSTVGVSRRKSETACLRCYTRNKDIIFRLHFLLCISATILFLHEFSRFVAQQYHFRCEWWVLGGGGGAGEGKGCI